MKSCRRANRVRTKHVGVEHRERYGHKPQTDRQCQRHGGKKRRALTQAAPRVANVLTELFQQYPAACLVEAFLDEGRVSEGFVRLLTGAFGAPPLGGEAIRFESKMRLDLVGEVVVRSTPTEQRDQLSSVSGPRTRDMAAARRRHLVDSRTRCSRPALVSE